MLSVLRRPAAARVILCTVSRCERVSTAAFRSLHPDGVAELPGATALRMPEAHSSPMLNRIVGLGLDGPATEQQLDDAIAAMAGLRYYVSVSPDSEPAGIGDWLLARGFEPSWGWMQFQRGLDPLPVETSLDLTEIGPERGDDFGRLLCAVYGLPEGLAPICAALPGKPGWHCWLALADDGEPAAAAALYVTEGAGYLGLAGTVPQQRGRGAQSALLAVRIRRAREEGCDAVFTETGEQLPDRPSASYRNIVRAGFQELYVLPNWLTPAP
jgi:GNAT superfamily N-acetyltransferase